MAMSEAPDCLQDAGAGLRHALAFTGQLRQRVIVNREAVKVVARDLGVRYAQAVGVVQLIRKCGKLSPERLACIAMLDRGYEDDDIAEIFGRSLRWARIVREQQDEIRRAEVIRLRNFETGNAKNTVRLPSYPRRTAKDALVPVGA